MVQNCEETVLLASFIWIDAIVDRRFPSQYSFERIEVLVEYECELIRWSA